MTAEIVFVLDRSGSMQGLEKDVIGGFNSLISEQQKIEGEARVTTVLFDNEYEVLHDGVDIQKVFPITSKEYFVRGATALLDAVGKAINTVKSHAKKKDKVVFVINTDGYENSSKEYNKDKIKELVKECEKKNNWKFVFLGANIDAFAEGGSMGFSNSFTYSGTSWGTLKAYNSTSDTFACYRSDLNKSGDLDTSKFKNLESQ